MSSVVIDADDNIVSVNKGNGTEVQLPSEESSCGRAKLAALQENAPNAPIDEEI